jgi:hypothetical protein
MDERLVPFVIISGNQTSSPGVGSGPGFGGGGWGLFNLWGQIDFSLRGVRSLLGLAFLPLVVYSEPVVEDAMTVPWFIMDEIPDLVQQQESHLGHGIWTGPGVVYYAT